MPAETIRLELEKEVDRVEISITLRHPVPDRLRRRLELACHLLGRTTSLHQLDQLATELRGVGSS
jgi:hypothetical protein